jgi:hypothetical protein
MVEINKELLDTLKDINEKLGDIRYDLKDIKNNLPKVPYYGDLLEDITRAIKDCNK